MTEHTQEEPSASASADRGGGGDPIRIGAGDFPIIETRHDAPFERAIGLFPRAFIDRHEQYKGTSHAEDASNRLLYATGHPDREAYARERAFYETLAWAANTETRYYSYESAESNIVVSAPSLGLRTHDLADISPHREWEAIVEDVDDLTDTDDEPYLSHSVVAIKTDSEELFEDVRQTANQHDIRYHVESAMADYSERRLSWDVSETFRVRVTPDSVASLKTVLATIREHHLPLIASTVPDDESLYEQTRDIATDELEQQLRSR